MARIDEALYALITGDDDCAAQLGTRVYPLMIPQNAALPAVCYQTITTQRAYSQQGPALTPAARIQITVKAASYDNAVVVANLIRNLLEGYKDTSANVDIQGVFLENEYDGFNLDSKSFTVRQDYRFQYYEE
jgi:hypothetical protein